jgi:hypothetical protein
VEFSRPIYLGLSSRQAGGCTLLSVKIKIIQTNTKTTLLFLFCFWAGTSIYGSLRARFIMASGLRFKPTSPAAVVLSVPLVFLSFVELSTVCLESVAILTQLKFDIRHPL